MLQTTSQELHWLSLESEREVRTRIGNLIDNTASAIFPPKRPSTERLQDRLQDSLKPHERLHCKTKLAGARSATAPGRVSVLPGMRDGLTVAAASLCEQSGNREQEQGCCSRAQRTDLSPRQQLCRRALPPRIPSPEKGFHRIRNCPVPSSLCPYLGMRGANLTHGCMCESSHPGWHTMAPFRAPVTPRAPCVPALQRTVDSMQTEILLCIQISVVSCIRFAPEVLLQG